LQLAEQRLEKMGPMSRDERIMLGTMAAAVCLWVSGDALGISAVTTAMLGLCVLLGSGVLQWKECLAYSAAWDTLFWFAGEGLERMRSAMQGRTECGSAYAGSGHAI
jgi:DASS family divalent anion:Na+ symporter